MLLEPKTEYCGAIFNDITWKCLILLSLCKKRPKKRFLDQVLGLQVARRLLVIDQQKHSVSNFFLEQQECKQTKITINLIIFLQL